MNLDNNPTPQQLRELLAQCDDLAGNHVLWVKRNGDVEIATIQHPYVDMRRIRNEPTVARFQQEHPEMQMRCETFLRGNEYVGSEGAANDEWVSHFFEILVSEWRKAKGNPEVAYIGISDRVNCEPKGSQLQALGIEKLSVAERIALVQDILDSIASEVGQSPLTKAQRQEVDRRLAAHRANPTAAIPWKQVEAEALARLRR